VIVIEKQGGVICAYNPDHTPPSNPNAPKRGLITEFSRKSRRGMLLFMNRMDYSVRTTFLTLTFHECPTVSQSNEAFKRFVKCVNRRFSGVSAVWRRENQPTRGAIHFHLLVFNLPYWKQKDIQKTWTRCTGEDRSIVHVKLLWGRRAAMIYVAKYIGKMPESTGITSLDVSPYQAVEGKKSIGRCWGYINKKALPLAKTEVVVITDDETRKNVWAVAWWFTGGRCGNNEQTMIFFADNASRVMEWIRETAPLIADLPPEVAKICRPSHVQKPEQLIQALLMSA